MTPVDTQVATRCHTRAAPLPAPALTGANALGGKPARDRDTVVFTSAGDIGSLAGRVASTGASRGGAISVNHPARLG